MDEFTQKLLQKTNARKGMLEQRRKDADARRAQRTPLREHQSKEKPVENVTNKTFDKPPRVPGQKQIIDENSKKNETYTKDHAEIKQTMPRQYSTTSSSSSDGEIYGDGVQRKKYRAPVPSEKNKTENDTNKVVSSPTKKWFPNPVQSEPMTRELEKPSGKLTPTDEKNETEKDSSIKQVVSSPTKKRFASPVPEKSSVKSTPVIADDDEVGIPGLTIYTKSPIRSPSLSKNPSSGIPGVKIYKSKTPENGIITPAMARARSQAETGHGSPSLKERMKRLREEQQRQADNDVTEIRRQRQAEDHKLKEKEVHTTKIKGGRAFGSVVSRSKQYEKTVSSHAVVEEEKQTIHPVPASRTKTPKKELANKTSDSKVSSFPVKPQRLTEKEPVKGNNLPGSVCVMKELPPKQLRPTPGKDQKKKVEGGDLDSYLDSMSVAGPPKPPRINDEGEKPKKESFFKPLCKEPVKAQEIQASEINPVKEQTIGQDEPVTNKKNKPAERSGSDAKRQKLQEAQKVLETIRSEAIHQENKQVKDTSVTLVAKPQQTPSVSRSPKEGRKQKATEIEKEPAKKPKLKVEEIPERRQAPTRDLVIKATSVCENNNRRPRVTEVVDFDNAKTVKANLSALAALDNVFIDEERNYNMYDDKADETINMDCNLHDITFNIDFSQFDEKLKEDRDTRFKKTYEQTCQEVVKERKTSNEHQSLYPRPSRALSDPSQDKQVFQSGYTQISEMYATATVSKPTRAVERPLGVQQMIQSFLEKAASQQSIVLQASQALNACSYSEVIKGSPEHVEAHRLLMLSTERRTALLDEVQRLKTNPPIAIPEFINASIIDNTPCMASLKISDFQLPLTKEFMEFLRAGRSDLPVYHFVCLVENGPEEVFCSQVISTNDATKGNFLTFDNEFLFKELDNTFDIKVKIFCMEVKKSNPYAFPAHKQKKTLFRRDHGSSTPQAPASPSTVFRKSEFILVGSTHVTLSLIKAGKYSLSNVPEGHPLANFVRVNFTLTPEYCSSVKGFLTIYEDVGGYGAWHRRWCSLQNHALSYWRYPDEEGLKEPLGKIELQYCTSEQVTLISRDLCARPHTLALELCRPLTNDDKQSLIAHSTGNTITIKYQLACDNKSDRGVWINTLNDSLRDWRAWNKPSITNTMAHYHSNNVHMAAV